MSTKRQYRVRLSRSTLSTASITVEAGSKNEALFLAGKVEEIEWQDCASEPEIESVEAVGEKGE